MDRLRSVFGSDDSDDESYIRCEECDELFTEEEDGMRCGKCDIFYCDSCGEEYERLIGCENKCNNFEVYCDNCWLGVDPTLIYCRRPNCTCDGRLTRREVKHVPADYEDDTQIPSATTTTEKWKRAGNGYVLTVHKIDEIEKPEGDVARQRPVCKICWDAPVQVLVDPCGHYAMCAKCSVKLKKKLCPICRGEILKLINVFE